MNPFEQKQRRTAVEALQQQIDDQSIMLEALDHKIVQVATGTVTELAHVKRLIDALDEKIADVAKLALAAIDDERAARWSLTFRQRLSWLLTGRP
jgi:hypothetical protein